MSSELFDASYIFFIPLSSPLIASRCRLCLISRTVRRLVTAQEIAEDLYEYLLIKDNCMGSVAAGPRCLTECFVGQVVACRANVRAKSFYVLTLLCSGAAPKSLRKRLFLSPASKHLIIERLKIFYI